MKIRIAFTFVGLLLPACAFAEVSDKMPSITRLWGEGFIVALFGYLSARYRIWTGILFGLFSLFFCFGTYSLLSDPYVGPAIIAEQGNPYLFTVYGSIILMLTSLVAGFLVNLKRKKPKTT